jgi:phosphoribosylamine--glycine ligase
MLSTSGKRILVVGGGGREHAIVWTLARSVHRPVLFCAPGNPGIAGLARCVPVSLDDLDGVVRFIHTERIELTVVGPEKPLALGLADRLRAIGHPVVGPSAAAARIESSKSFAKELMTRAKIPTASAVVFDEAGPAIEYVRSRPLPLVIKADGLAQGKGVVIARTLDETVRVIEHLMTAGALGEAGRRVLIEQFLTGEEVTCMAVTDGRTVVPLVAAQDHKQLLDEGRGPNTGGMGAYAPVPFVSSAVLARVEREVFHPLLAELNRMGIEYQGVIYAGLMLCRDGPHVLEFNCRFGDPEAQAVLPLLDSDAVELFEALARGRLDASHVRWRNGSGVCVVLASEGYPDLPVTGRPVAGVAEAEAMDGVQVFHAGTALKDGTMVTQGGRVFGVAAQADTLQSARERAYRAADLVQFEGKQYRKDIGARGVGLTTRA